MKKFFKLVLGGAALAGTACGTVYFLQKVLGWDIFKKKDDDDDDDFDSFDDDIDDIGDDDDSDDREYVTLDMEEDGESEKENLEQETDKAEEKEEETGVPVPEEPVTATE